ncbi:methyltransferase [Fusarium albosuccineum]|uniref:Arsenite methyltransferase n=1 Tax=Fusarium albosuccineum TaxID=1237068 RepID=A0A8H4LQ58_9HYPO|nr:methyltransferase [Fusarium albosuccineum]
MTSEEIYAQVSERYGVAAQGTDTKYASSATKAFGYLDEELALISQGANLGLGCGNPLATATLREGETVIDLGSGAGLDVFLSAKQVGPKGKAIGIDMNKTMLSKACKLKSDRGINNADFVESRITEIPLETGIADCIISNCVVNLVPHHEKQKAFDEMFRLLKPGGRVAISDILAKKPLPEKIRNSIALYVGCVAGASQVSEYQQYLNNSGFEGVVIVDTQSDLNVYLEAGAGGCCSSAHSNDMAIDLQGENLNHWVGSYQIYAVKEEHISQTN